MKIGLALPYSGARAVAHWAKLAEDAGWDGCFLGDAIWCEDPLISLAAAAMATEHIRLGTMIIPVPLRRPWKIASESLALDHLIGRAIDPWTGDRGDLDGLAGLSGRDYRR